MRVAVNLNMFHPELPLLQRYKAAAAAGFRQVEVSVPYSEKAEDLKNAADSLGLSHTLINAPPGDWSRGFRGIAALPNFKKEFQESIGTAIQYAKTLKCDKVHVMAGIPANSDGDVSKVFLENVSYAAAKLGEANLICLIEPINHYTIPGYFLSSYEQAKAVIDAVKLPNLKIQYGLRVLFYALRAVTLQVISHIVKKSRDTKTIRNSFQDIFHAQQICGQISASIQKYKELIGYIQVAQVPSRNEPITSGEIDYKYIFGLLQSTNPNWTIGLEHNFHEAHGAPRDWVRDLGLTM